MYADFHLQKSRAGISFKTYLGSKILKHFLFIRVHAIYSFSTLYLVQSVSAFLIHMCMTK